MENIVIRRYQPEDYLLWNNFVKEAKNATFLFHRDFMEYHKDRFEDFSLLIYEYENLIGIVPAHIKGNMFCSHLGLSYGGIIYNKYWKSTDLSTVILKVSQFLSSYKIKEWIIKPIPNFYDENNMGIDWEKHGFLECNTDLLLRIDYSDYQISKSKLKHFKRRQHLNYCIKESMLDEFWEDVLSPLLSKKFDVKPVHSFSEINYLKEKFPKNIKQFSLYCNDEIHAGITIFESEYVVKSQYGATTEYGKSIRALDLLFIHLIKYFEEQGKLFFDMGTVMDSSFENNINTGLLNQKKELGCKECLFKTYRKIL